MELFSTTFKKLDWNLKTSEITQTTTLNKRTLVGFQLSRVCVRTSFVYQPLVDRISTVIVSKCMNLMHINKCRKLTLRLYKYLVILSLGSRCHRACHCEHRLVPQLPTHVSQFLKWGTNHRFSPCFIQKSDGGFYNGTPFLGFVVSSI